MFVMGIVGTMRAGKGAVVEFLMSSLSFTHYSVSEFISREIRRHGLPVNRDTMRSVANDLRREFGVTCLVDTLYGYACMARHQNVIIESLRNPEEVLRVKNLKYPDQGLSIGIDADRCARWLRAVKSGSVKDNITFEEFVEQERLEMSGTDPFGQNISEALKLVNVIIYNNGTIDALHEQIRRRVLPMLKTRA